VNRPEEALQRQLVAFLRLALPPPWMVFHIPNGGGRSKAEAGVLKAMGVLAGMPDLILCGHHDGPVLGGPGIAAKVIAIELKAPPKPGSKAKPRVSDAQKSVIEQLGACGIPTLVCNDFDQAVAALRSLGVPLRGQTR